MSALKAAFEKAGYKPSDERLWNAGVAAWTAAAGNTDRARDELFKLIERDAELILELFKPYHRVAAQKFLEEVSREAREEERRRQAEEASSSPNSKQPNGLQRPVVVPSDAGHRRIGIQNSHAGIARPQSPRIKPRAVHEIVANRAAAVHQSLLDTFRIEVPAAYGKMSISIGDCTPTEALSWVGARERDSRFVRLLVQNLPPDEKIRKHRRDAGAVAAFYAEAMRPDHAA